MGAVVVADDGSPWQILSGDRSRLLIWQSGPSRFAAGGLSIPQDTVALRIDWRAHLLSISSNAPRRSRKLDLLAGHASPLQRLLRSRAAGSSNALASAGEINPMGHMHA